MGRALTMRRPCWGSTCGRAARPAALLARRAKDHPRPDQLYPFDRRQRRAAGQIDKTPGDGTYHTQHWTPGDRVIQRFRPELNDVCAGGTPVQVVTGWYEYAAGNARRPRLGAEGDTAVAGSYGLPFYSVPPETLQWAEARNIPLALDGLALNGYTLNTPENGAQAGGPLAVDLALAGGEQHGEIDLVWRLRPADQPELPPSRCGRENWPPRRLG